MLFASAASQGHCTCIGAGLQHHVGAHKTDSSLCLITRQFIKLGRDLEEEELTKVGPCISQRATCCTAGQLSLQAQEMTTESTRRFVTSCFAGAVA